MHQTIRQNVMTQDFSTAPRYRGKKITLGMAAVFMVLAVVGPISAQTFRGAILGTVTDPNGAVVPEATVTAKNVATGIERSTVTDEFGNYSLPELQTGTYEVTVQKSGFQISKVTGAVVEVSAEKRVDVVMAVAGSGGTGGVAFRHQVRTTTQTLGGTISTRPGADLPINGRDFTKFLGMVPGATRGPSRATDLPGSF